MDDEYFVISRKSTRDLAGHTTIPDRYQLCLSCQLLFRSADNHRVSYIVLYRCSISIFSEVKFGVNAKPASQGTFRAKFL